MSPPETSCNEEIAPWKFNKGEGCGGRKGSPERYRHRQPDSYSRRHKSHNDRAHYGNRVWRRDSPYSRHPSSDLSRVQYDRTHISDEKRHHDDDRSKASSSAGGREQTVYTIKRPWKGHRSPGRPRSNRSRWDEPPRTSRSKDSSYSSEKSDDNLHIIFNHINDVCTQSNQTQPERPMSFIDKLIADEAMRMLSQATSLQKTTYLNVPFVPIETTPSASVDSEATEISKPESGEQTTEEKQASVQDAAVVTAADSALLQKSAEQVTKKLINQLTTMSKYDLKQIIDNPGGKYETALNRHAQNKLRAEVRKQLKSIGLNELGSSCVAGDGTVEPDVAIDANKIPPALLAQIGQALDLDLEDLTQTDSESVEHVVVEGNYLATLKDTQSVDGTISPKSGNKYSTAVQSTSNQEEDPQSSNKTLTKVRVAHKPSPTTPGRKKDNNVQNANATVCIEGANSPGAKTPKSKTKTRNRKKKGVNGPGGKQPLFTLNVSHEEINLNATLELSRTSKKGIMNAAPKPKTATEGSNISNTLTVQCKAHDAASTYNNNLNTNSVSLLPVEPTRVAKIVPFLRISTVDELNRRLEDHEGTKSVDPEQATELNRTEHTAVEGSVQSHDNVSNRMETNKFYGFNTFETDPTNTADDCIRLSTVLHPCPTPNISNRESDESIQNRLNNDQRSESASTASVQREQEQPNTPIFQRLIERRKKRSKSAIAKHLEGMLNKKGETHITEDGEIAIGRVNGRTLKRNNDYLAMICPTGRKALPFANAKWIPQKDMNRQRNSPADTTSNAEQCTAEAVANVTDELKNKLPVVPDTHLVKQRKNRSQNRWNRPMPLNSSGVLFNNQTVGKDVSRSSTSERIASLSLPSREDQILNEAYDQYTINTVAEDEPDETEDQQNPAIDGTVQDTSNLTAIANLPSIRVRATSISQELSTPDTSFEESVLKNNRPELSITAVRSLHSPEVAAGTQSVSTSDSVSEETVSIPNLPTVPIVDSKESIASMPSPEPNLDTASTTDVYILGGDSEQKCVPMDTETYGGRNHSQDQVQEQATSHPDGATPQPLLNAARLQSLYAVTEQLQSIDAQTMDLYNRKTQIDAIIMQLNAERMDINQQLVQLHNKRGEQMNYVRITLLELGMSNGSGGGPVEFTNQSPIACSSAAISLNADPVNHAAAHPTGSTSAAHAAVPQQERTIRRITPIGGNSVLMKIFQRRRAPSERSTEENPPTEIA